MRTGRRGPELHLLNIACVTFFLLLTTGAGAEEGRTVRGPEPETTTRVERIVLENGLEVLLEPDRAHPRVAVCVSYLVGLRDQPAGYRGLAHLTEHLMFQGSRNVGEDELFLHLERAGATARNATTDPDYTSYWAEVPSNHLATLLWLESDRMTSMLEHLNVTTLEQQRDVVLSEFREEQQGSPLGRTTEIMLRAVFPLGHPYHSLVDRPPDISAIRMADVQWFFQRWYGPNNARLAIVGDFDVEAARALVERYFGTIRASYPTPPQRRPGAEVQLVGERRIRFATPVIMPEIRIYWPTPAFQRPDDAELDFAARVLAIGPLSRLHRRLVTETGFATSVAARQHSYELTSFFVVRVVLARGQRHEDVLAIIDEEIERLAAEPITEEMAEWARYHFRSQLLLNEESLANRAFRLSYLRSPLAEDGIARIEDDLARYDGVTVDGVSAAVRHHLPRDRRAVLFVVPAPDAPHEGAVLSSEVL